MTSERSPLIDLLPPGSEVKDTKQPTDLVTREASSEQDIRLTIKLFEEANRRQDERIQQLEKDLAEPKNLTILISKYRFLFTVIFCTLLGVITWLVVHYWDLYRSAMDRRFEDAQQIQMYILEQKISNLVTNQKERNPSSDDIKEILKRLNEIKEFQLRNIHSRAK